MSAMPSPLMSARVAAPPGGASGAGTAYAGVANAPVTSRAAVAPAVIRRTETPRSGVVGGVAVVARERAAGAARPAVAHARPDPEVDAAVGGGTALDAGADRLVLAHVQEAGRLLGRAGGIERDRDA